MSKNSVTGRFRDIEISFNVDGNRTYMNVRNLISDERQVRVMYQKSAMSGLANWRQFQLSNKPVLLRCPTEVLEAYRLTFFVDNAEPISARTEKILAELDVLRTESPIEDLVERIVSESEDPSPLKNYRNISEYTVPKSEAAQTQEVEKVIVPREPEPAEEHVDEVATSHESESVEEQIEKIADLYEPEPIEESVIPSAPETHIAEPVPSIIPKRNQEPKKEASPIRLVPKSPTLNADTHLEFKITVPSLPASALAKQRKLQTAANERHTSSNSAALRKKKKGVFGQFAQALGLSVHGKRGKAYYQEKGEIIQNDFQDKLAKLEKDYNEGYGLDLLDWDPETLCEEETAILLLNLMVNEMIAWQKETGRATPETKPLVETLTEVSTKLRQVLKQTRGISTPSPTLFPELLAENARDLEKIQTECDAYLDCFSKKLVEQEKKHAAKVEVIVFKKFLIEFIRDFLFVEVIKNTQGSTLPKRLNWFLDLVDSEVIPIEIGKTKVSPNHHKVKGACTSEFESGTVVEVVSPGLQSKDGKRVSHMAIVIEGE